MSPKTPTPEPLLTLRTAVVLLWAALVAIVACHIALAAGAESMEAIGVALLAAAAAARGFHKVIGH